MLEQIQVGLHRILANHGARSLKIMIMIIEKINSTDFMVSEIEGSKHNCIFGFSHIPKIGFDEYIKRYLYKQKENNLFPFSDEFKDC